ncbi:MAG: RNA methyltransferase [Paludibacteraceae bacterium]|nr:RNA methyltransferase [Paludibacteraceae bacterium]
MNKPTEYTMLAKTFKGLEEVLAAELTDLGANEVQIGRRAVSFTGDKALLYRANLCLRTASRVLVELKQETLRLKNNSPSRHRPAMPPPTAEDRLYEMVKAMDWSRYMTSDTTFAIDATTYSDTFRNSRFVTYRVKDAIADYWYEKEGKRPNVKVSEPDLLVNVHIANETVTISLDSSGESLHKRGYRVANTEAPINEALAAGMLLLAGWNGQSDFYDPMCGSGTLLIEAALIARNIPPGVFRRSFAFEKWRDFDADLWSDIYNDDSRERDFTHKIYGSDASFYAVQQAEKNIKSAGVQKDVELRQIRLEELKPQQTGECSCENDKLVMMNPPYGERLASNKDIEQLYANIGSALKHQFAGATAWIISSNEEAMKCIGLKPSKKYRLLNGELDCRFNRYDLFAGRRNEQMSKYPNGK